MPECQRGAALHRCACKHQVASHKPLPVQPRSHVARPACCPPTCCPSTMWAQPLTCQHAQQRIHRGLPATVIHFNIPSQQVARKAGGIVPSAGCVGSIDCSARRAAAGGEIQLARVDVARRAARLVGQHEQDAAVGQTQPATLHRCRAKKMSHSRLGLQGRVQATTSAIQVRVHAAGAEQGAARAPSHRLVHGQRVGTVPVVQPVAAAAQDDGPGVILVACTAASTGCCSSKREGRVHQQQQARPVAVQAAHLGGAARRNGSARRLAGGDLAIGRSRCRAQAGPGSCLGQRGQLERKGPRAAPMGADVSAGCLAGGAKHFVQQGAGDRLAPQHACLAHGEPEVHACTYQPRIYMHASR